MQDVAQRLRLLRMHEVAQRPRFLRMHEVAQRLRFLHTLRRAAMIVARPCRPPVIVALACLVFVAPVAHPRDLVPVQTFSGTMPLDVPPLVKSPITSRAALERAWATCRVKTLMPEIDFRRRIVVAAVGQSSKVSFVGLIVEGGNLKTNVAIAPDMPTHRTCTFVVVERAGIESVNGVVLGQ